MVPTQNAQLRNRRSRRRRRSRGARRLNGRGCRLAAAAQSKERFEITRVSEVVQETDSAFRTRQQDAAERAAIERDARRARVHRETQPDQSIQPRGHDRLDGNAVVATAHRPGEIEILGRDEIPNDQSAGQPRHVADGQVLQRQREGIYREHGWPIESIGQRHLHIVDRAKQTRETARLICVRRRERDVHHAAEGEAQILRREQLVQGPRRIDERDASGRDAERQQRLTEQLQLVPLAKAQALHSELRLRRRAVENKARVAQAEEYELRAAHRAADVHLERPVWRELEEVRQSRQRHRRPAVRIRGVRNSIRIHAEQLEAIHAAQLQPRRKRH